MTERLTVDEVWVQKAYDSTGNVIREQTITFLWARRSREYINELVVSYITFVANASGDIQYSLYRTMLDVHGQIRIALEEMNLARTPYEVEVAADKLAKRVEWMNALTDAESNIAIA